MLTTSRELSAIIMIASVVLVSPGALAQEDVLTLSEEGQRYFEEYGPTGIDPEELLNCDIVHLARRPLDLIVQNRVGASLEASARLRAVGKALCEAVLSQGTGLGFCNQAGILAAIEFDWVTPATEPPFGSRLPMFTSFWGVDDFGAPYLMARAYGLDGTHYAERLADLSAVNGHLREFVVWEEPALTSSQAPLLIGGFSNSVFGPTAAGTDLRLWSTGQFLDTAEYVLDVTTQGNPSVPYLKPVSAVAVPSLPLDPAEARLIAIAAGTYYPSDVSFDQQNPPPPGLVFGEGRITVTLSNTVHEGTFVAVGNVCIVGGHLSLAGAYKRTLAVSLAGNVSLLGHEDRWFGEVHAPLGTASFFSAGSLLHGIVMGSRVTMLSMFSVVTDGTHPYDP